MQMQLSSKKTWGRVIIVLISAVTVIYITRPPSAKTEARALLFRGETDCDRNLRLVLGAINYCYNNNMKLPKQSSEITVKLFPCYWDESDNIIEPISIDKDADIKIISEPLEALKRAGVIRISLLDGHLRVPLAYQSIGVDEYRVIYSADFGYLTDIDVEKYRLSVDSNFSLESPKDRLLVEKYKVQNNILTRNANQLEDDISNAVKRIEAFFVRNSD